MKDIFKDVNRKPIEYYEQIFVESTGGNYEKFLIEKYIDQDLSSRDIALLLGLSPTILREHLSKYNILKLNIQTENKDIFYKTPSIIEQETGRKLIEIYNELSEQGLSLTEIATKLQMKYVGSLSNYLYNYNNNNQKNKEEKLIVPNLKGKQPKTVDKILKEHLGISYKDFLKQKYIDEKLSPAEISNLIGVSPKRISERIREYGLSKTPSQARKDAIERGKINYNDINKKREKTRSKLISRSNTQDTLRELIKHHLEYQLENYEGIEIITGYNEWSVLGNLEIDIPIIIFYDDNIYKIAIEYNGEYWHDDIRDGHKEDLLIKKGWKLFTLTETTNQTGNLKVLEEKAKELVDNIMEIIQK